jgi:hypothetical protein
MVSTREGERLTCGVREPLGPAWQRLEEADSTGQLHMLDWVKGSAELGRPRRK